MAPLPNPSEWSSNWKKLQARLEAEKALHPAERKADSGQSSATGKTNGVKRRRIESSVQGRRPRTQRRNMGGILSRASSTNGAHAPGQESKDDTARINNQQNGITHSHSSLSNLTKEHDIPASSLLEAYGPPSKSSTSLSSLHLQNLNDIPNAGLHPSASSLAGKYIALDCEMVGVGPRPDLDSALARISLVNYNGIQLYDSYVLPKEAVTDYRTHVSGITSQSLKSARTLETVQADVAPLLDGKILVGHALQHDLDALFLSHPRRDIRDTSTYVGYRKLMGTRYPSLKRLAKEVLGVDVQAGEHSSVEDARVAMWLYRREKEGFEREWMRKWGLVEKGRGKDRGKGGLNNQHGEGEVEKGRSRKRKRKRKK